MKKMIVCIWLLVGLMGCATTRGQDVGAFVELGGKVAGLIAGVDVVSWAGLGVTLGSELAGKAVAEAVDNNGQPAERRDQCGN